MTGAGSGKSAGTTTTPIRGRSSATRTRNCPGTARNCDGRAGGSAARAAPPGPEGSEPAEDARVQGDDRALRLVARRRVAADGAAGPRVADKYPEAQLVHRLGGLVDRHATDIGHGNQRRAGRVVDR